MAFDYVGAREVAESIINEFGAAGSVVKKGTKGGYDNSGNLTPDVPDVTIAGIITPLLRFKQHEIDGQNILASDSYIFLHSDDAPAIGMQTTLNSDVYRIVDIKKLDSVGDVNVYRRLQLRK